MRRPQHTRLLTAVSALLLLAGCGGNAEKPKVEDRPVESLYNEAADALEAKDYDRATLMFEEVERQHPYSQWATQAELMAAYSYYKDTKYDEAALALDRFMELHPGNKDIDYALYLKALCYYEQISDVARDQAMTQEALRSFETLISRFPDSKYTRDATLKRDLTLDHLAGKEMEIGRYYLNRGEVNAAINRFRTVVKDYQTTMHVPEALHRLVEAYMTLGLKDQATRVAAVLGYNYPGSAWYEDTYKLLDPQQRQQLIESRGFVDRTVESLFKPD
jgi:outer membrane protein assembly factor BamD